MAGTSQLHDSVSGVFILTEKWIREHLNLNKDSLDDVRSISLPGSYYEKVSHLGRSLIGFVRLKHLDLSRNALESLEGIDHLKSLETLNIYYNNISTLRDLYRLRHNKKLKELDVRLNPVTKNEPDYRLFLAHMLVDLKKLDDRGVRDSERKAALLHFNTDQAHLFDKSINSTTSEPVVFQDDRKKLSSRKQLVRSLAPSKFSLEDDTDELLDLMAKRDYQHLKFECQSSNSMSAQLSPSPSRPYYSLQHKQKTAPGHFDDFVDTKVRGNFTPTPTEVIQFQSGERVAEQKHGFEDKSHKLESTALADLLSIMQTFVEGDLSSLQDDSDFKEKFRYWFHAHTPSIPSSYVNFPHSPEQHLTHNDEELLQKLQEEVDSFQHQLKTANASSLQKETEITQLKARLKQCESDTFLLNQQLEETQAQLSELPKSRDLNKELQKKLQKANTDNKGLQELTHTLQEENHSLRSALQNAPPPGKFNRLQQHISELEAERDAIGMKLDHALEKRQHESDATVQVHQLAVMLQESHKSLVATNSHLLQELEDVRQRHFQEITQMNLNYENLRTTISTLNTP